MIHIIFIDKAVTLFYSALNVRQKAVAQTQWVIAHIGLNPECIKQSAFTEHTCRGDCAADARREILLSDFSTYSTSMLQMIVDSAFMQIISASIWIQASYRALLYFNTELSYRQISRLFHLCDGLPTYYISCPCVVLAPVDGWFLITTYCAASRIVTLKAVYISG